MNLAALLIVLLVAFNANAIFNYGDSENILNLMDRLFDDYNKEILPRSEDVIQLHVGLILTRFVSYDSINNEIVNNFMLSLEWNDDRLRWYPEDYDDLDTISISSSYVWTPDLELFDGYQELYSKEEKRVLVFSDGTVYWRPEKFKVNSKCWDLQDQEEGEEMGMMNHGIHECNITLGLWTYNQEIIELKLAEMEDIKILPNWENNVCEVVGTSADVVIKSYDCCDEQFGEAVFSLKLKHKHSHGNHMRNMMKHMQQILSSLGLPGMGQQHGAGKDPESNVRSMPGEEEEQGERPKGERPEGERPERERPEGERPEQRPEHGRPEYGREGPHNGTRPGGQNRPTGGRPEGGQGPWGGVGRPGGGRRPRPTRGFRPEGNGPGP